jgi:Flp pilus assembly protein TadG
MSISRFARKNRRGAVIVEFALVVPFLFLIVFAVIDFSRAYAQLNAINSGLREGARYAATYKDFAVGNLTDSVKTRVQQYATVFGYNSLDMTKVTFAVINNTGSPPTPEWVQVTITAHPLPLPILTRFLGVSPLTVTRSVRYRWERAAIPAS